ncbi:CCA tRNA nucleotidyltransferase 1, mitochondrial [Orchesella cincta]|uniref:CCA tRNA nucleotidyltransferase 1, mitochondrial n=1 Tax=Orchesella cincta TaxID=48709 RepID=A0A1D2MTF5_ORCCI|nr:CCA tRNA nucleotidyltransferase 1, mitochondrial [Orchesella cincta]
MINSSCKISNLRLVSSVAFREVCNVTRSAKQSRQFCNFHYISCSKTRAIQGPSCRKEISLEWKRHFVLINNAKTPDTFGTRLVSLKSQYSSLAVLKRIESLPKGTLKTMKIDNELMMKILTPEVKQLASLFEKNGYELRLAGGPVRDLLVGKIPVDLDFATTATPEQMKTMFEAEGIRMINTKGEQHGTITARINDKENFEVTTLRIDVVTDGRHAEVEFTTNWELDAARRDLTVNSMFLDLNGEVQDYFNGAEDLRLRKVRFVGDAEQRIQEDYLRILRYFRFYGRLSVDSDKHEQQTLDAIRRNMQGLQRISGERIWMELKKVLTGNFSKELMLRMLDLGIAPYIGLPEKPDTDEYKIICERMEDLKLSVNPITLLTALLKTEKDALALNARLKLSAYERDLCLFLILHRKTTVMENSIRPFQRLLIFSKSKATDTRQWVEEVMKYDGATGLLEEFKNWQSPKFPVSGNVLIENKVPGGRAMSRVMNELKDIWIESNFTATTDELVSSLPQILEKISANKSNK